METFHIPAGVETPAVLVDLDILESNLRNTADAAKQAGIRLRPHTKTHKSVWIAQMQLQYGACGVTVAKLGEAEVMAQAGIKDILIAYPIIGKAKLNRLAALLDRAEITVSVDSMEAAQGLSELGEAKGKRIPLYIDVNSGLNRCGLAPGSETAQLVRTISRLSGVRISGLMTHAGQAYKYSAAADIRAVALSEAESLLSTRRLLEKAGVELEHISVGSTPTSKFAADLAGTGVTEMRPGAYVFGDAIQLKMGLIHERECALTVAATTVSAPRQGTAIIDSGSKTLTSDVNPHHAGYGYLPAYPDAVLERLSEEHGIVQLPEGLALKIGEPVVIIPNHCCTTVNLHDTLYGIRNGKWERTITVDARGKVT